jgi:hypothetical protein
MGKQLHKRLPKEFVAGIIERFDFGSISEKQVLELLGIKHTNLYKLRKKWLESKGEIERFSLYRRTEHTGHQLPEEYEQFLHKELTYIKEDAKYYKGKYNFELISEMLDQEHRVKIHRNTIRRWAIKKGYYSGDRKQTRKVYTRFEMSGPGELYQHDTSNHAWLPNTGRHHDLIMTEDDHSRLVVNGILVEKEGSWKHLQMTRAAIEAYGMPMVYYVDRHSTFKSPRMNGIHNKSLPWKQEGITQFRRALETLGIGVNYAPKGEGEAKGKIEKRFDYFQRRIPYLCEKHQVMNLTEANKILAEEIMYYNERHVHAETNEIPVQRWKRGIDEGRSKLRPIPWGAKLDLIFSLQYPRVVRRDGTIQFHNKSWNIGDFVGEYVTVCLIPQKKFIILKDGQKIWEYHI